jgi:hypothetical protein
MCIKGQLGKFQGHIKYEQENQPAADGTVDFYMEDTV